MTPLSSLSSLQGAGTVSRTFAKGDGSRPLARSSPTARLTGTQGPHQLPLAAISNIPGRPGTPGQLRRGNHPPPSLRPDPDRPLPIS